MKNTLPFIVTKRMVRDLCVESSRARVLHRLHCVALVQNGLSSSEVSRIFSDSPRAVAYWVQRFKEYGLVGLEEESKAGRPPKLNSAQTKKLQSFLIRARANSKHVNAEIVAAYISKEFEIAITPRQCWRILKRLTV
jgi:transposase